MFREYFGFILLVIFAATPVFSQKLDFRDPVYTFNAKVDQVDKLIESPTGILMAEHVTRMTFETKARFEWRYDGNNQLFVEPLIRKSVYHIAEDELTLGVFAEYRHPLAIDDKMQLRWRGGLELRQDVFNRITMQVALNTHHSKSRTSRSTLRYRYRNQNEARTFKGYDQHEVFVSFQQAWKPVAGKIKQVTGMVYGEFRKADAGRFDYTEIGARLNVRFEPHQDWKLTTFAKGFIRKYGGNFSSDYDFVRRDQRLAVGVEANYDLGQKQSVSGALGWEVNRSNIKTRSYSGVALTIPKSERIFRWAVAATTWCSLRQRDQSQMKAAVSSGFGSSREMRWRISGVVRVCANRLITPGLTDWVDSFRSVFQTRRGAGRRRSV